MAPKPTLALQRDIRSVRETSSSDSNEKRLRLSALTRHWGDWEYVSLYLDRCQVETPTNLVEATWRHVNELRTMPQKVVDFGAGDGRFSRAGRYGQYLGYEIDRALCDQSALPSNAKLINRCAFSKDILDADVCIGNPPFVRNQDLPTGWRQHASKVISRRVGFPISGLANAWQYFFLLAIASVKSDGLCALVLPYEWVTRPSASALRDYVRDQKWGVTVYRLADSTFDSVLTTSSITIVDKSSKDGRWTFFSENADGSYTELKSESGSASEPLRPNETRSRI